MVQKILYTAFLTFSLTAGVQAQTIWNGPKITFTKLDDADHTLPENQDRITPTTWITRGELRGIYNLFSESSYTKFSSPANTEWATGTLTNYASLSYQSWEAWAGSRNNVPGIVGKSAVLHLKSENIYIGITFLSWSQGNGGFSYERTTAAIPAPVKLISFTATKNNNAVTLNWQTATEEETASFSIERSADGQKFTSIGSSPAAGSSTSVRQYSFTDLAPLPVNFYRLRISDNDGAVSYSTVVVYKLHGKKLLEIFPNPASQFLRVQWNSASQIIVVVMDAAGRTIKTVALPSGESSVTIDIANLKPGVYYLKAGTEQKTFIKK